MFNTEMQNPKTQCAFYIVWKCINFGLDLTNKAECITAVVVVEWKIPRTERHAIFSGRKVSPVG